MTFLRYSAASRVSLVKGIRVQPFPGVAVKAFMASKFSLILCFKCGSSNSCPLIFLRILFSGPTILVPS